MYDFVYYINDINYEALSNFPKISQRFSKILRRLSESCTNVSDHFRNFSKIAKDTNSKRITEVYEMNRGSEAKNCVIRLSIFMSQFLFFQAFRRKKK